MATPKKTGPKKSPAKPIAKAKVIAKPAKVKVVAA